MTTIRKYALPLLAGALLTSGAAPPLNLVPALWLGMMALAWLLRADPQWPPFASRARVALAGARRGLLFGIGANVVALRFIPAVVASFTPLPWAVGALGLLLLAAFEGLRSIFAGVACETLVRARVPRPPGVRGRGLRGHVPADHDALDRRGGRLAVAGDGAASRTWWASAASPCSWRSPRACWSKRWPSGDPRRAVAARWPSAPRGSSSRRRWGWARCASRASTGSARRRHTSRWRWCSGHRGQHALGRGARARDPREAHVAHALGRGARGRPRRVARGGVPLRAGARQAPRPRAPRAILQRGTHGPVLTALRSPAPPTATRTTRLWSPPDGTVRTRTTSCTCSGSARRSPLRTLPGCGASSRGAPASRRASGASAHGGARARRGPHLLRGHAPPRPGGEAAGDGALSPNLSST